MKYILKLFEEQFLVSREGGAKMWNHQERKLDQYNISKR
jgi:hypothetical protein